MPVILSRGAVLRNGMVMVLQQIGSRVLTKAHIRALMQIVREEMDSFDREQRERVAAHPEGARRRQAEF